MIKRSLSGRARFPRLVFDEPVPDIRGAMAGGVVDVPASVRRLLEGQ